MQLSQPSDLIETDLIDNRSESAVDDSSSQNCYSGCGACCVAPAISSPLPGMPNGKAAGERCVHLMDDKRCELFGQPNRPSVCAAFLPTADICGKGPAYAMRILAELERATAPG